jgi:prepilin-type N-terminal cleavage/methylation domain-containing protein
MTIYQFCWFPVKTLINFVSVNLQTLSKFLLASLSIKQKNKKFSWQPSRSSHKAKTLGFTIIEILVVLIIIGILGAIVGPSWVGFVDNQRLNTSQNKIFTAIKTVQSEGKTRASSDSTNQPKATSAYAGTRSRLTFTFPTSGSTTYRLDNVRSDSGVEQPLETGIVISSITSSGGTFVSPASVEFDSRGVFVYGFDVNTSTGNVNSVIDSTQIPICINLSTSNTSGKKKTSWIRIQTLLGALSTGKNTACS